VLSLGDIGGRTSGLPAPICSYHPGTRETLIHIAKPELAPLQPERKTPHHYGVMWRFWF